MSPGLTQGHRASLPIVDLSGDSAAEDLKNACLAHGFFFVTNHGVDPELISKQFAQSRAFCQQPLEQKKLITADHKLRGYTPPEFQAADRQNSSKADSVEGVYLWFPDDEPAKGSPEADNVFFGRNQWPSAEQLPDYKPVMEQYATAMTHLTARLRRLIAEALDLPDNYFEQFFTHPAFTLRPMHYPGEKSNEDAGVFACGAHSDYIFTTLLVHDGVPGLQIQYNGEWRDVEAAPDAFICNVGDMLEYWSAGRFKSTRHRVLKPTDEERYSCGFFACPDHDAVIESLPSSKDFKDSQTRMTAAEYLKMRIQEGNVGYKADPIG